LNTNSFKINLKKFNDSLLSWGKGLESFSMKRLVAWCMIRVAGSILLFSANCPHRYCSVLRKGSNLMSEFGAVVASSWPLFAGVEMTAAKSEFGVGTIPNAKRGENVMRTVAKNNVVGRNGVVFVVHFGDLFFFILILLIMSIQPAQEWDFLTMFIVVVDSLN
jgi:hypothetical protein